LKVWKATKMEDCNAKARQLQQKRGHWKLTSSRVLVIKVFSLLPRTMECFSWIAMDADFSGLYGVEDSLDPVNSKSRTG